MFVCVWLVFSERASGVLSVMKCVGVIWSLLRLRQRERTQSLPPVAGALHARSNARKECFIR